MNSNFYGRFFRLGQQIVRKVYPKYKVILPQTIDGPAVYITHHQNLFGPFITLLWFPKSLHAWILHVFLDRHTCYRQYVDYTFTKRFGWNRTLSKICAFLVSFLIAKLLNSGKGIPVYRGSRKILKTFHLSVKALKNGESIVIFPDIDYSDSTANVKELYEGFLSLDRYYYRETGEHVCFIPLYVSKKKRLLIANRKIYFREGEDVQTERKTVLQNIHANLNELAEKCGDL